MSSFRKIFLDKFRVLNLVSVLSFFFYCGGDHRDLHSFPTRRSSDLRPSESCTRNSPRSRTTPYWSPSSGKSTLRSEEHTSELQSRLHLVCRLLLEKKKKRTFRIQVTEITISAASK